MEILYLRKKKIYLYILCSDNQIYEVYNWQYFFLYKITVYLRIVGILNALISEFRLVLIEFRI